MKWPPWKGESGWTVPTKHDYSSLLTTHNAFKYFRLLRMHKTTRTEMRLGVTMSELTSTVSDSICMTDDAIKEQEGSNQLRRRCMELRREIAKVMTL